MPRSDPHAGHAASILAAEMAAEVESIERFPTGLAHYVYDARLTDGRSFVIRLTRPEQSREFVGALYWYVRLNPLGIRLPDLYYEDVRGTRYGLPVMIMERLPGTDLGHVYASLADAQKRRLAAWVVDLQRRVATLPPGPGFGYALSYEDPLLFPTWREVLEGSLQRTRQRIQSADVVDVEVVARVSARLDGFDGYLRRIEPVPFLHDTTTKNVIINERGEPTGLVDVDSICFGDPLFTPALTRMALLARGHDTAYVDHWERHLDLTPEQQRASLFYTAIHCAAFLSELGQPFNNEAVPPVDPAYRRHLAATLGNLLEMIR